MQHKGIKFIPNLASSFSAFMLTAAFLFLPSCTNPLGVGPSILQQAYQPGLNGGSNCTSQTDQNNSSCGFGGGTQLGTAWSIATDVYGNSNYLMLNQSGSATDLELDPSWTPAWSNIIGYWRLNGTAGSSIADSTSIASVVGPNGTFSNTNASTYPTTGYSSAVLNQGISFDGVDDSVNVAPYANINSFPNGVTAAFWAKSNTATWNAPAIGLVVKRPNFGFEPVGGTNIEIVIYLQGTGWADFIYTIPVSIQNWHHYALSYDNSTLKFYLDGALVQSASAPGVIVNDSSTPLSIGSDISQVGRYFNGSIDEVAVWNTPISSSAIATIYQHQSAKYAGTFTSRVFDSLSSSASWINLSWTPTLPFNKPLPDYSSGAIQNESSTSYSSQSSSLMAGIVGLWHLDEVSGTTVYDRSGNSNNGTAHGGVTFGTSGKMSTALQFDGTSGYVDLGNSASLDLHGAMSISGWFNISNLSSVATIVFGDFGVGLPLYNVTLNQGAGGYVSGNFDFEYYTTTMTPVKRFATVAIVANQWTHFVTVRNPNNSVDIYLNGVLVNGSYAGAPNTPNATSLSDLGLGRPGNFNGQYFPGIIDEIAIWNRVLSSTEVLELYRRGANRIKYQVRSCSDSACSANPTWLGPDNTNQTYFSEFNNNAIQSDGGDLTIADVALAGLPVMTFSNFSPLAIPTNRFFQYRAIMESDDTGAGCNYGSGATWCSPELQKVQVSGH